MAIQLTPTKIKGSKYLLIPKELEMTGTSVRDVIYERLERRGIPASDISTRFDDVVAILNESFGGSVRVIVYKTVVELCQQILLLLPQVTRFTGATNGDCGKPTDSELTTDGMARATGTVTDGLTGSNNSPQTTTVVHILTDPTASQAVAKSCLVNTSTQAGTRAGRNGGSSHRVPIALLRGASEFFHLDLELS